MKILLTPFFLLFLFIVNAQNEIDLYRFSKTTYQGSARFEAMGGSFGALGADLSSSQINPAGYGRFSSSQIGGSLFGGSVQNKAIFNSNSSDRSEGFGGVGNAAVVLTQDVSTDNKGFQFVQVGLGYNRIESYRNSFKYSGQQYYSLLDDYVDQAYGYYSDELSTYFPFSTDLAYQTGALVYNSSGPYYQSKLNSGDVIHDRNVNTTGGMNEFFLSVSANYLNRLYIGANIGVRTFNYEEKIQHSERLTDITGTDFRGFDYDYQLKTSGTGINLKIGAIYLLTPSIRLGLAMHTPTFTELKDEYSANMISYFDTYSTSVLPSKIPNGVNKYGIRNPTKFIGSLGLVFGMRGSLNVDVEYLNYQNAYLTATSDESYPSYDYKYENDVAEALFQRAINLRIGGEIVVLTSFYVRAGYGYYGNAFKSGSEINPDQLISGGLGYKRGNYNFDIAFKRQFSNYNYYSFSRGVTELDASRNTITLSATYKFN
jgi:hypothetical protein